MSLEDFKNGNIEPSGKPGSIAGPQPYSEKYGGGRYSGSGNEIIIHDAANTVVNRVRRTMKENRVTEIDDVNDE